MSDFEAALITAIVEQKNIRDVLRHKINSEFFSGTQTRAAFTFLERWYQNPAYADTPSWESFQHDFQEFVPVQMEESIIALCDKVRERKLFSDLSAVVMKVGELAGGNPQAAFDLMKEQTVRLVSMHNVDDTIDMTSRLDDLRREYFDMKSGATGLKGKPYPWPALNEATLGLQDQHLVFLYGRPKSCKTWLALEMIKSFHKAGARPLIFSQELSDIEVCRRFVALSTGVNYSAFLRGALPPQEEADFLDNLEAFAENPPVHVSTITQTGPKCLTEITSAIQEYQATVVLIDGVYFLGSDWKEIAEITRGLKRITKQLRVPIIGTTQANRSRGKKGDAADGADDFAYGDAFYQDCDLALRVTRDIEDLQLHQTKIFTAAIREGQSTGFTIHTRIAGDFTQKAVHKMADEGTDMDGNLDQDKMDAESDVRQ